MKSGNFQDSMATQVWVKHDREGETMVKDKDVCKFMIQWEKEDSHVAATSALWSDMQASSNGSGADNGMWLMTLMQLPFFTPIAPLWSTDPTQSPQQEYPPSLTPYVYQADDSSLVPQVCWASLIPDRGEGRGYNSVIRQPRSRKIPSTWSSNI